MKIEPVLSKKTYDSLRELLTAARGHFYMRIQHRHVDALEEVLELEQYHWEIEGQRPDGAERLKETEEEKEGEEND